MVSSLKIFKSWSIVGAVVICTLMVGCLYGSFQLLLQSANTEQIEPINENLLLTNLAGIQETILGLLTATAFLGVVALSFSIYVERPMSWRDRPRATLASIGMCSFYMLFMSIIPNALTSRAIALVRYYPQESVMLASNIKVSALCQIPFWALFIALFIISYLKILNQKTR